MNGGFEYREEVGEEAAGRTTLAWLTQRYRHSTETAWRERIAGGEVRLDGEVALAMDVLRPGQALVWRRPPWEEPTVPLGFAILHRDDHLLAVAKPRGLPSVPNGGFLEHTLLFRVRRLHPEAVPMHRLGRGTSGLVLFARTDGARRAVAAEWRRGGVEKEYRALVRGLPATRRLHDRRPRSASSRTHGSGGSTRPRPAGKPAVSHVRVLAAARRGRAGRGDHPDRAPAPDPHPPGGGRPPARRRPAVRRGRRPGPDPGLPGEGGYHLHAHRLALTHPATGRRLELECPLPPALRG